ncbi:MAG: HAD hydrolase-like protein, partial [Ruthenibacterium sp.]
HPNEAVHAYIRCLRDAGIAFMIVSNNRSGRRVSDFCAELGVPYVGHAGKPGTRGLTEAMAQAGSGPQETAMLGDKLLTDVLAAKRCGCAALMVEPLGGARTLLQKLLHALQAPAKRTAKRRGQAKA